MAQQQSQPEATADEAAAPASEPEVTQGGSEPDGAHTADPVGSTPAPATETPAAEGEPKPEPTEEEKAAAEKAESELKANAEKYAKDQIAQANRTMAAARRAERAAKDAAEKSQTEITSLKQQVDIYGGFVKQLQERPMEALGRLGFKTFKEFAEHCIATGGEGNAPTVEDRLAAIENDRKTGAETQKRAAADAAIEESRKAVFAYIDGQADKYDLVTTDVGHERLWRNIVAYHRTHGVVPDEAVDLIAEEVEKELATSLSKSKRFGQRQPANNGAPATGAAAPGASTSGRTLAGKPTSGAPATKKYPVTDPDALERAINEDMRAAGELG